jgi:hypothetical protein
MKDKDTKSNRQNSNEVEFTKVIYLSILLKRLLFNLLYPMGVIRTSDSIPKSFGRAIS